jgi:hypothetical protein
MPARWRAREPVAVRSPERNTRPKVYYRGADQASLDPTRTAIANDGLIWADVTPSHPSVPVAAGRRPIDKPGWWLPRATEQRRPTGHGHSA